MTSSGKPAWTSAAADRPGRRPPPPPSHPGRPLLATVLHHRLGLPQTAVAALVSVRPETINRRIREKRQLLGQAGHAIQPGPYRLADVPNRGRAWFIPAPDGESTEVHVLLVYDIPGGDLGKAVAKYFGEEPHQQLDDDLRRLKQVLEAGEVVRSEGAPWGKRARQEFPQRPAQPLSSEERAEVLV